MIRRLLLIVVFGVLVSGCFMAPLALIGPATSGFSTASIIQSGVSTGASYVVRRSTGKSISEHVLDSIGDEALKQTYAPEDKVTSTLISGLADVLGITTDGTNLYITDKGDHIVEKVVISSLQRSTIAGTGSSSQIPFFVILGHFLISWFSAFIPWASS